MQHKIENIRSCIERGKEKGETRNTSNVSSSSSICYPSVTSRLNTFYIMYLPKEAMKQV